MNGVPVSNGCRNSQRREWNNNPFWVSGLRQLMVVAAALALTLTMASAAEATLVTLRWDSNADGITEGYLVYYGTAPGAYQPASGVDVGNTTQFQVDLQPGRTYYFAVRAYSSTAGFGPASEELSFSVPAGSSINVSSSSVVGGGTVTSSVVNGPGGQLDWVGLFAVGASSSSRLDWKYLSNNQTPPAAGLTSANVSFAMPTTPGQYNLRFFPAGSTTPLATSATITVTAPAVPASITPSATTVAAGGLLTLTLANGPGGQFDWVGLYPTASGAAYLDWKYLSGSRTAPAAGIRATTLTFTMPATAGTYTLRWMANNSTTTQIATTSTITVTTAAPPPPATPSITPSVTTVAGGATLTVTVANGPGNQLDWVGLYPTASGATYVDWKYLSGSRTAPATGLRAATVSFTMPTTPGTYTLRLMANNSTTQVLASTATITVTTQTAPGPSIVPVVTTIPAGATLTVNVANGPGNQLDWVGLYPTASGASYLDWKYLSNSRTAPAAGVRSATLTFLMPATPGTYTLRLMANNSTSMMLATTTTITVTPPPSVTPSATTVARGGSLTLTIANGPGGTLDWVGLYPAVSGATYLDWKYLNGVRSAPATGLTNATVTFTMPTTPGSYIFGFFENNSTSNMLAASVIVTVP